ncbi:MAG TPA: rRNA maturation RNase YbeY [Chloroflexota bacterium]
MATRLDIQVNLQADAPPPVDPALLEQALAKTIRLALASPNLPLAVPQQPHAEVNLVLTDDEGIHALNQQYRGVDSPTDVLSFSQLEGESVAATIEGTLLLGDIVISVDTATRQAAELGHELMYELSLLAIHGALHLLGYDHQTDAQAEPMDRLTGKALGEIGFGHLPDERVAP